MRSKLFVPGSRPALFAKALASDADALSMDLEDAVDPSSKEQARETLGQWLDSLEGSLDKTLIVRINSSDSPWQADDLARMVHARVDVINLPKAESVEDIRRVAARIEQLEQEKGLDRRIGLLLNIETPRALRLAAELAGASSRVVGLQLGYADLFALSGMNRRCRAAVEQTLFSAAMAAAEAGVYAYDAAFGDIRDQDGYREEALLARDLGYLGKTCIHPSQIALANEVFQPDADEIAFSLKVVAAAEQASEQAVGAYVVDGKMIDAPLVQRAQSIVAQARRYGLLSVDA